MPNYNSNSDKQQHQKQTGGKDESPRPYSYEDGRKAQRDDRKGSAPDKAPSFKRN